MGPRSHDLLSRRVQIWVLAMLLVAAGSWARRLPDQMPTVPAVPIKPIRAAVGRALPLLQQSARVWSEKAGCISCHHQGLGLTAVAVARERGFAINEQLLRDEISVVGRHLRRPEQAALFLLGNADYLASSYALTGLGASSAPSSSATDAEIQRLLASQHVTGQWTPYPRRLPLEGSEFSQTALTIRALTSYGPPGRKTEIAARVARARKWLTNAEPIETEDLAMQMLGLAWAGAERTTIARVEKELLRLQQKDGGWRQISTRGSDAYATGQALVALNQAGRVPTTSPAFRSGIEFLMTTQHDDGSWFVTSRRTWKAGMPYFESGFPFRSDQFISYAATAWATMALVLSERDARSKVLMGGAAPRGPVEPPPDASDSKILTPLMEAALNGTLDDVERLLAAGAAVNAATSSGLTPLICAAHDPAKTARLLAAGAEVDARTDAGHTALIVAADSDGAAESVKLMLEQGADVNARTSTPAELNTALVRAALRGDRQVMTMLLDHGAVLNDLIGGSSALIAAVQNGDTESTRFLLDRGANVETRPTFAAGADAINKLLTGANASSTPLMWAADSRALELVELLIARHADVNAKDAIGMTALGYAAAAIDRGSTATIKALLAAGADPRARTNRGETAFVLAARFRNAEATSLLLRAMEQPEGPRGGGPGR